jgi:hypothetical protein
MMHAAIIVASALLGGVLFRIRGGGIDLKTDTVARLVWSIGMAVIGVAIAWDYKLLALAPAYFLGCLCPWWNSIDMGHNEGSFWRDFGVMAVRGVIWVLFAAVVLGFLGYSALYVFAGLLCPVCYAIGWKLPNTNAVKQGTEYGEILFGAVCGAGLALAVL